MATDVTMPRLSDSMEEGTVLKWLVEEGGEVKRGEPLVEIETDKANMTYEADTDGVLDRDRGPGGRHAADRRGDRADRRGRRGRSRRRRRRPSRGAERERRRRGGAEPEAPSRGERRRSRAEPRRAASGAAQPRDGNGDGERVKASPVRGAMARRAGRRAGAARGLRARRADREGGRRGRGRRATAPRRRRAEEPRSRAPPSSAAEPERGEAGAKGEVEVHELTRLQQTVARRMAESKATAPDFSLALEVDMTAAVELRARLKEVADPAPSFNDMVVKAARQRAARAPARERRLPRRQVRALLARERRHRRGGAGRARRAHRSSTPTRSRWARSRATRARLIEKVRDEEVTPPELLGRHVHGLEPRHVRHRAASPRSSTRRRRRS